MNGANKLSLLLIFITVLLFTAGCSSNFVCEKPNVIIDNTCCIDSDSNGVCDSPDLIDVELVDSMNSVDKTDSDNKIIDVSSEIDVFAETFANTWNKNSYNTLYNLFDKNYRYKYRQAEFNFLARHADKNLEITNVKLLTVKNNEAFYVLTQSGEEKQVSGMIVKEDGKFKHSAFSFFVDLDSEVACEDDDCYVSLAVLTGNRNHCDSAGKLRLDCLEKIGVSKTLTTKIDECVEMSDYYGRVECLEDIAVKENTVEPCWEAEYDKQTFMCMGYVVAARGDATECSEVISSRGFPGNREQHTYCILGFVKETHDTDACDLIDRRDNIVLGSLQEGCYKESFP